jgi:flagellar hook capping protein FlgD/VCBS repeat protein
MRSPLARSSPAAAILVASASLVLSVPGSALAGQLVAAPFLVFDTGATPYTLAIGDLSGDAEPDLAVAHIADNTVSTLLGIGDGTFAPRTDYATGLSPRPVAIGDLNGDGKPDLAVSDGNADFVTVLLNTSALLFAPPAGPSAALRLAPPSPNPGTGDIAIEFALPRDARVSLRICDVAGRVVRTLLEGTLPAGAHDLRWDGRSVSGNSAPGGIYFLDLRAAGERLPRRFVVIR